MRHPFEALPTDKRRLIFVPLLVLTLVVMGVLNMIGAPLNTGAAPQGIVSFELAGNVSTARTILNSWDALTQAHAGFSLGFDFLFMPLYSTTIGLACVWASGLWQRRSRSLASAGLGLAWGQWLAALLDALENVALTILLLGSVTTPWPQVAWGCAVLKFALVILGLLYAALGVLLRLIQSRLLTTKAQRHKEMRQQIAEKERRIAPN